MGHILTPEFLTVFKDWEDCPDPLISKKLISLDSLETWYLFCCNEFGVAYGCIMGSHYNESGSISILELEQRFIPYHAYYNEIIVIPSVIVDFYFTPKLLSEAKAEFNQEKRFALEGRNQILINLTQILRG